jgi:predicted ATPase/DNA-binding CsgD family transcriptional regulator
LAGQVSAVHGLPRAMTSFVGRADEAGKVAGLLDRYPMVTVTGPGGVGKTRLAGVVAGQVAAGFADGAWLVELAAVQDAAQVPAAVASALGVPQLPGDSATGSLAAAVARLQLLLVLDNCEHVLAAVAELCAALLAAADDVRVLATSREPVGVLGEARFRLRPLPVPDPGTDTWPETGPDGGPPPAVALFEDRARLVDPDFILDGARSLAARRLVARLDGMPLAIELAAARVEALGLDQLLDRLEAGFELLAGGDRAAAPRHRSLTATVEWSYHLLDERERAVFRKLAVFPGPFTLDAAVAVAGDAAEPVVLHLVDCSLLAPPRTGPDGRARYLMLETLRAFGRDQLTAAGEFDRAAAALAGHALGVAGKAAAGLETGAGEVAALRWLDAEDATLQQALAWALDHDPEIAVQIAIALAQWMRLRGRATEGYQLLTAAAGRVEPGTEAWCTAQFWLGVSTAYTGDYAAGLRHFTAARDGLVSAGPSPALAIALAFRGHWLLQQTGQQAEGAEEARRALDMSRDAGYPAAKVMALMGASRAASLAGDAVAAVEWARQACQVDPATIYGDLARDARIFLAISLKESGDVAGARASCTELLAMARQAGDLNAEGFGLSYLAQLDSLAGQPAEAWARLRAALEIALRHRDTGQLADCLAAGVEACAATGLWAEAITVRAAEKAWTGAHDLAATPSDRRRDDLLRPAERVLGLVRVQAARARGAAMTLDTAAEYLLLVAESAQQAAPAAGATGELGGLSARERELVTLVAQGLTDAQIAGRLYISVSTVRSHLDRIRDKTGSRRRADLTRLALQAGLA